MNGMPRSGWIAAIALSVFSISAVAQERTPNTPDSPEVLNADSSTFISTPDGVETITDGSFEAGSPNPNWNEFSLNFGTPLCTLALCSNGGGTGPNTGDWWAWFGGIADSDEESSVSQDVTFPDGSATLTFFLEAPVCENNPADYVELLVDGNQEWVLFGNDPLCGTVGYSEQTVDLSAYANGSVRTIEFHGETFANAGPINFFIDDVSLVEGEGGELARFLATKTYNDGNTGEVAVTLSCNTGLPLEQTQEVAPGDPVNFTVGDFEQGALDCEMFEAVPEGYSVSYNDNDGVSDESCSWVDRNGGQFTCQITNALDEVEIEVTKVWIDENPQFNAQNVAGATWSCSNVAFPCELGSNGCDGGNLDFFGNPGVDAFSVFPDWEDGTTCSITEVDLLESGIEVDDSECQGLVVFPGAGASCTIFNTRLFEGIPTLSQYGLGLLALLMLGVGFVAFRRVI